MIYGKTDVIENKLDKIGYLDCRIEHFPYKIEHCQMAWAKKILFWLKNNNNNIEQPFYKYGVSIFNSLFCVVI